MEVFLWFHRNFAGNDQYLKQRCCGVMLTNERRVSGVSIPSIRWAAEYWSVWTNQRSASHVRWVCGPMRAQHLMWDEECVMQRTNQRSSHLITHMLHHHHPIPHSARNYFTDTCGCWSLHHRHQQMIAFYEQFVTGTCFISRVLCNLCSPG